MAINYPKMAAIADKLIKANGKLVTLKRQSHTPADSSKPWRGSGGPTVTTDDGDSMTAMAVIIPNDEMDDKEAMRRGVATAYLAPSTLLDGSPPALEDLVTFNTLDDNEGYHWHIHGVKIINPGAIRVLYEAELEH